MFSFNNLTFRSKIVGSFVILILLTAVLVATSVYKISSTREITIDKIENLNVRYERTRKALDSFYYTFRSEKLSVMQKTVNPTFQNQKL